MPRVFYFYDRPPGSGRNGDGAPAFVSKTNGEGGVFVYYVDPLEDSNLNSTGAATLKTMMRNALMTEAAEFQIERKPILLVESFQEPSAAFDYSIFESNLGAENFDLVQTSSFTNTNWDAGYSTIVVLMNGGSVGTSDMQELSRFVNGGCRVVLFGGSGTSSFRSGMNTYLLTTGGSDYSWTTVAKSSPALTVWHKDHPLMKNVPELINQTDFGASAYVFQVADINARVAARNGDGYPCLVSKTFGNDGGLLVYYTDPIKDQNLLENGAAYYKTILDNAINTPVATIAAGTRRKPLLLVQSLYDQNPNIFGSAEQALGPENTDLLITTSWDPTSVWAAYYRTVVIFINGGMVGTTSCSAVKKLVEAGVRVVIMGGSASSSFRSGMGSYLMATGDTDYSWVSVSKAAPALSVWDTRHPLVAGLPKDIRQSDFIKPEYMLRISDSASWIAARNGDALPALLSKPIGVNGGVLVYFSQTADSKDYSVSGVNYIKTILHNSITAPSSQFAKSKASNPTLLVEVPSSDTTPQQYRLVEDVLGGGNKVDIAQTTDFAAATGGYNISAYTTVVIVFPRGTATSSYGPSTDSWNALRDFVAAGGRAVMLGSICSSTFSSRVSAALAACSISSSWDHASKPDVSVQDTTHPIVQGWKYPDYNFTYGSISEFCIRPTDPSGWVALSTGKGQPVLSTFNIGAGAFVWSPYIYACPSNGKDPTNSSSCFDETDSTVVQEILTRSVAFPVASKRTPICDTPVDIMLVIDGSASISSSDFVMIRKFVVAMTLRLDMTAARIGVVQFSDDAQLEFGLTGQTANISADAAKIKQLNSGTNLASGLQLSMTELVLHGREKTVAKHAMLVLSDGNSNKGQDPVLLAASLKVQGVDIYSVGVGDDINATQLQLVASSPTSLHYFKSSEYDQLYKIINSIVDNTCVVCQGDLDSVVLMDDSNSITDGNFAIMEDFVKGIANGFDLDSDPAHAHANVTTQLGVVAFADSARTIIGLSNDEKAIDAAVDGINRVHGNTAIGDAINLGQQLLTAGVASIQRNNVTAVAGDDRSKIIFLLTDGVNNRGADPVTAAASARNAGTIIYAVGVGTGVDSASLTEITGSADRVFTVDDFATLKAIQFTLLQRACKSNPHAARGRRQQ